MNREILSLDFYGEGVAAALASVDEKTDTLRIRHVLRQHSHTLNGGLVRELVGAQETLNQVFKDMDQYAQGNVLVVVGVRGNFLSFRRGTGFAYTQARNHIIRPSDIENAIQTSLPNPLDETLEVLDILPQTYSIDEQPGVISPLGMAGCTLEAVTFISLGVASHLANLNRVLAGCGCEDYQLLPAIVSLGETVLTDAEKGNCALLLDIGENGTSAILYHKDILSEAWELPLGLEQVAEKMSDLLGNDMGTTRQLLRTYEQDPVMDEVLEDSARPLVQALHKELVQSLTYIQHPPTHLVLCGQLAQPALLKLLKNTLGTRKARLGGFNHLIADCDAENPVYHGALALLQHALAREQAQLGVAQVKEEGILGNLLAKLGLNGMF